jgi:hypothetical protein
MKVGPALLWILAVSSALVGALAGIVFEGLLDKYFMLAANLDALGIVEEDRGRLGEVLSTLAGATLGAAFVGLVAFVVYGLFLSTRR